MGYKARRRFRLTFEDEQYAELEVKVTAPSFGELLGLGELAPLAGRGKITLDNMDDARPVFEMFVKHVTEWNLEDDDDQLLPRTYDGLMEVDPALVVLLIQSWMQAVGDIPVPLEQPSSDGSTSAAPQTPTIPMAPLSASQAS